VTSILALDSSGAACSVAFWAEGALRAHRYEAMPRGQSERLVPMVIEVMAEAGRRLDEVALFAATIGPGAFTGLRIGLATLRGLALAADRPMLGVTSFEAVASAIPEESGRTLLVLLESKRAELYAQSFAPGPLAASEPLAISPGDLAARFAGGKLLLAGDAVGRALPALAQADCDLRIASERGADAAAVAALAARRAGEAGKAPPAPLYLRPPDVTLAQATAG